MKDRIEAAARRLEADGWSEEAALVRSLRPDPLTCTVEVSRAVADRFAEWTRVRDLDVDWFKVVPQDDGTAEVLLSVGEKPRTVGAET